ncbi:MbtH family protein [Streptomyces sp. NPDC059193]|uniref:MbtH family protein n=1 Tax=Streptomyces sp. NPDC059193 TaxID=3346763 RepID=UPI0036A03943
MSNPFENDDAFYLVLVNGEGQHSLWPAATGVPAGWRTVHGAAGRQSCLDYVEEHWTDMRPHSLAGSGSHSGGAPVPPAA